MSLLSIKKEINYFVNGTLLILDSVFNFKNEEEMNIVLDIFNGEKGGGLTIDRYKGIFEDSFDDEVSSLQNFVCEFLEDDLIKENFSMFTFTDEGENILSLIAGFELSKRSLANITALCNENSDLKEHLFNFVFDEEKHEEYFTNPFHEKGIHEFEKLFGEWSDTFQKDIEAIIGKTKIEAFKKDAQAYVNSQYLLL